MDMENDVFCSGIEGQRRQASPRVKKSTLIDHLFTYPFIHPFICLFLCLFISFPLNEDELTLRPIDYSLVENSPLCYNYYTVAMKMSKELLLTIAKRTDCTLAPAWVGPTAGNKGVISCKAIANTPD